MKVYYRVLRVDQENNAVYVRYWTDVLTEEFLANERDNQGNPILGDDGKPVMTRTDYYISLFNNYNPSEMDIIAILERNAPTLFFETLEYINSQPEKKIDMSVTKNLIGQTNSFDYVNEQLPPDENIYGI